MKIIIFFFLPSISFYLDGGEAEGRGEGDAEQQVGDVQHVPAKGVGPGADHGARDADAAGAHLHADHERQRLEVQVRLAGRVRAQAAKVRLVPAAQVANVDGQERLEPERGARASKRARDAHRSQLKHL